MSSYAAYIRDSPFYNLVRSFTRIWKKVIVFENGRVNSCEGNACPPPFALGTEPENSATSFRLSISLDTFAQSQNCIYVSQCLHILAYSSCSGNKWRTVRNPHSPRSAGASSFPPTFHIHRIYESARRSEPLSWVCHSAQIGSSYTYNLHKVQYVLKNSGGFTYNDIALNGD